MFAQCYPADGQVEMHLDISYTEADQTTEITLTSGGREYNPFEQEDDGLGVTILKQMAKQIACKRDGSRSIIMITL